MTLTPMVSATSWKLVDALTSLRATILERPQTTTAHASTMTLAAYATVQVRSTSADVLTSLKEIATATETSLTPSACVAGTAQRTTTAMAFAMTPRYLDA